MFISIEGIDGSGKSSVSEYVISRLRENGQKVILFREPGATILGERVRDILLNSEFSVSPVSELLLYFASRAQLIEDKISPALEKGEIVLCDRFIDSSIAYQGAGLDIGMEKVQDLFELFWPGLYPDLTILLDSDPGKALRRINAYDRIEKRGLEYFQRVREGFLSLAERFDDRIVLVDADVNLDELKEEVWNRISSFLRL